MEIGNLKKRKEIKLTVTESPIEEIMLSWFKKYGLEAIPQYEIPPYRVDFAFMDIKLVVECDGAEFHESDEQQARDRERTKYLRSKGWKVARFWGYQIYQEPWEIIREIMGLYYKRGDWESEDDKYDRFLKKKNEAWNQALSLAESEKSELFKSNLIPKTK